MAQVKARIAHLSDLHVVARPRGSAAQELSMRFVSFGREIDPARRAERVLASFAAAEELGATSFVVSGDLTELGTPSQMEALAEVLLATRIAPERIVLVPGNHDLYSSPEAFRRALEGPLAPFRRTAAEHPGKVVETDGVVFFPLDVACHQRVTRSTGVFDADAAHALDRRLADSALRQRPAVVVQHHPPFPHASRAWQWFDGLQGWEHALGVLGRHEHAHVLHGHLHSAIDRAFGSSATPRVFGATATVDDERFAPRLRIYDVARDVLVSRGVTHAAPRLAA